MTELYFGAPVEFTHRQAIEQVLAHLVWSDPGLQRITVSVWPLLQVGGDRYRLNPSSALRAGNGDRQKLDALVANSYAIAKPFPAVMVRFEASDPGDLAAGRKVRRDTPSSAIIVHGRRLYFQAQERKELTILADQPWAKELAERPTPPSLPHLHAPRWTLDSHSRHIGDRLANLETGLSWVSKLEAGAFPLGHHGQALTLAEFGRMQAIIEACYLRWLEDGVEHLQFFSQQTIPVRRPRECLLARYPTVGAWMRHALVPSISVEDVLALWWETATLTARSSGAPRAKCTLRRKGPPVTSTSRSVYPVIVTLALAFQDGIVLHLFPRARELPPREFYAMQQLLRADGLLMGLMTVAGDRPCSELASVGSGYTHS